MMKYRFLTLLTVFAMATATMTSCRKENVPADGFRATIEKTGGNAKTHINPDWANETSTSLLWSSYDLIKVANYGGQSGCQTLTFGLAEGENTASGTFFTSEEHADFFHPGYVAIYPAYNADESENTIDGTTATFNIPATQVYKENSFGEKSMPMVACSSTQALTFTNVFGGLCFPLVGDSLTVTRIVLTSANASDLLYGTFTVDCNTGVIGTSSNGGNAVTLDCSATPVTLNATTPTYFCIMVPPSTLTSGLTITVYDGTTKLDELSTTKNPNITRNIISLVNSNLTVKQSNDLYTINADGYQVYFSQGNLQYQASTNTWRFALNQWDYVGGVYDGTQYGNVSGSSNNDISESYSGWIDLFGWGTSGYNHGAWCYQPWSTSGLHQDYRAYGEATYNLYDQTGQADWGYNAISNGGNQENSGWRTLTIYEWAYVLNTRTTTSGIRYAKANVNEVNGIVLLPDNWNATIYALNNTNSSDADYTSNTITASDWTNTLEANGAVFLPAAGWRRETEETEVIDAGYMGSYWSASYCTDNTNNAGVLGFTSYVLFTDFAMRHYGFSVRLVREWGSGTETFGMSEITDFNH